jgi:L-alanine-DL-glutamate epimerase-like enolase superfamily enzyme
MLSLNYYPYDLKLSEAFTVSSDSRTHTEAIFVEIKFEGKTGYGQASFPPYMKERREDNLQFLARVDLKKFSSPLEINAIHKYLDEISPLNTPSKAAIDIALYDLLGKVKGIQVYKLFGLEINKKIFTSFTIGIGDDVFIIKQVENAKEFKTLKVKLNGDIAYNKNTIDLIRSYTKTAIAVDFNQGLEDKETAIEMIEWLANKDVFMVEQPLPVKIENDYKWLKSRSPIPVYGDESIQNAEDVKNKKDLFHGVNIKLMKCGGISKAYEMAVLAKSLGLKIMIGCMMESVCAVTAAAHLASMFDIADLDGNILITNDPFIGITIKKGEVIIPDGNGLGLTCP